MAAWTNIPDSDLDPESPITTSLMLSLRDNPIAIAEGASGAPGIQADSITEKTTGAGVGIDSVVGSAKVGTGEIILTKVIEIGDWNMDLTPTINVAHGLTLSKIRSVSVLIRADDGTLNPLSFYNAAGVTVQGTTTEATNVELRRSDSGSFDTTFFNATSFNRGWIYIKHAQ